ncbi:hypothetical protein E2C01_020567 [Portunus trituberculatus]|uniref:Uncharacterized protein n=1 Tax=Portunus trituberculatus TaxID=210409 RepID=A0A5B7E0U5_PORTR|nr:hypothetical protein [Portunus trituberculatus]
MFHSVFSPFAYGGSLILLLEQFRLHELCCSWINEWITLEFDSYYDDPQLTERREAAAGGLHQGRVRPVEQEPGPAVCRGPEGLPGEGEEG